jgi:cephalosporin hydroxylase
MTLDELSLKYDTDKGSSGHFYTKHYEQMFESIRLNIESVLEVGIGSGASLRMWRDYFLGAMIYGVDMNPNEDMGNRIQCYECEQTNCDQLRALLQDKKLEIIVEDASHDQEKTMKTLDCLWPILETKGWYVIEDMCIDSFPPAIGAWYGKRPEQIREFHMLKNRAGGSLITFIQKR